MRQARDGARRWDRYGCDMFLHVVAVANWDPDRVVMPWADQRLAALRRAGVTVEVLGIECVTDKRGYLQLWRAVGDRLARGDVDLVAPLYGSFLGLLCALRRVPCALSFAGSDLNGRTEPGRIGLHSLCVPASQLAAALAAGVSVRNPRMRDALWWPAARRRARVIPSGVDTTHFRPIPRDQAR